jgi:predicted HTH domain antitoxin
LKQINFRLTDQEYKNIEEIAKILKKSIPSILKEYGLKEITKLNRELALELYKSGQIGLKRAWLLSKLTFSGFIEFLMENKIDPNIPDDLDDKLVENALNTNIENIFPKEKIEYIRKKYGSQKN